MSNKIYQNLLNLIKSIEIDNGLEKNILHTSTYRDDIYLFKKENKIDFYLCISKETDNPRVELQISNPFSKEQDDYIIVGEFYDFIEKGTEDVEKTVKAILSNEIRIINYMLLDKVIKIEYSYGYYLKNEVIIFSEIFNKKTLFFPWNKKKLVKKIFEFEPWIKSEYTIKG